MRYFREVPLFECWKVIPVVFEISSKTGNGATPAASKKEHQSGRTRMGLSCHGDCSPMAWQNGLAESCPFFELSWRARHNGKRKRARGHYCEETRCGQEVAGPYRAAPPLPPPAAAGCAPLRGPPTPVRVGKTLSHRGVK